MKKKGVIRVLLILAEIDDDDVMFVVDSWIKCGCKYSIERIVNSILLNARSTDEQNPLKVLIQDFEKEVCHRAGDFHWILEVLTFMSFGILVYLHEFYTSLYYY